MTSPTTAVNPPVNEPAPGRAGAHSDKFSWLPAVTLFFVAPLVAEFLLGNMSITRLGMLAVLAPLYGGGALLIREGVRRAGRGWMSIFLLALAYGVLEEGCLMQSLFNPDFLGLHQHLLRPAFVPLLGMGAWWTVFVLTLHAVWSISVPIALCEALFARRSGARWTGKFGLGFVALVFVLACVSIGVSTVRMDQSHFVASPLQLASSGVVIVALVTLAFALPRRTVPPISGVAVNPWIPGAWAFLLASAFLVVPSRWGWLAVAAYLVLDALAVLPVVVWRRRAGWGGVHRLALAGGATMAYAWHAFLETPALGRPDLADRLGNALFAVLAAVFVGMGAVRTRRPSRM